MDINGWIGLGAAIIAGLGLLMTYMRTARMQGGDRARLKAVEDLCLKLATVESVSAQGRRIDDLEKEVQQVANALTKLAVLETKLDGLDRLMTRELDEIKHSLRSFIPGSPPPRVRRTSSA